MTEQTNEGTFDPADHTVAEVNEYLATADDAERQRVLDAEKDGQNRSSVKAPTTDTGSGQTVTEAGESATEAEGEKYQKGYEGFAPSRDGDNPVDLTLAGVTKNQDA